MNSIYTHEYKSSKVIRLSVLRPLILLPNLGLLLRSNPCQNIQAHTGNAGDIRKIICDIECLPDFFRRLSLNHIGDGLTASVKKRFDVQIIRSLDISVTSS